MRDIAIDSLRRMPPDKAPALRLYTAAMPKPTAVEMLRQASWILLRGSPLSLAKNTRCSFTVSFGQMTSN